jgi:hypothetical protein
MPIFDDGATTDKASCFGSEAILGKGKTMLLCGIIDELIKSITYTPNVSYFFCQALMLTSTMPQQSYAG